MVEEANPSLADNNRASSNRRSRENKCSGSERVRTRDRVPRRDPYIIEVDRGRNCYACGGFRYMA